MRLRLSTERARYRRQALGAQQLVPLLEGVSALKAKDSLDATGVDACVPAKAGEVPGRRGVDRHEVIEIHRKRRRLRFRNGGWDCGCKKRVERGHGLAGIRHCF